MRIGFALAATFTMLSPPVAQAQGVKVAMGEEVAFALADGAPADIIRTRATPDAFETWAGSHFSAITPPDVPVTEGTPMTNDGVRPDAPIPDRDRLRFRFLPIAGTDNSLLLVHNGYDRALVYRARITSRGNTEPTDVCLILPGKSGIEHWPYAISAIEVSDFELVAWKPEDGAPCK